MTPVFKGDDPLDRLCDRNNKVLVRIYIGRRFQNDAERLEKLFDLYAKTTEQK